MLCSWSRGNYFRVGGENRINSEWDVNDLDLQLLRLLLKLSDAINKERDWQRRSLLVVVPTKRESLTKKTRQFCGEFCFVIPFKISNVKEAFYFLELIFLRSPGRKMFL